MTGTIAAMTMTIAAKSASLSPRYGRVPPGRTLNGHGAAPSERRT
jgi:hypothetical protein